MSTPEEIDSEFMKLVSKAKQLLAVDYVDELKDKQASMLREVLAELMVYVQQKIDQETGAEEASPETAETGEVGEVAPAAPVSPPSVQGPYPPLSPTNSSRMMSGGRSKEQKQKRKQKGGYNAASDIDRVLNNPGPDSKHDPRNISSNSPDTIIGSALHPPFTAGRVQQISSMGGLSDSEKQNMLPNMGGQSGGGRKKKPSKK